MSKKKTYQQMTLEERDSKIDPEIRAARDKDRTPVRGKFIFHEVPGGKMEFVYRYWPGDDIQKYSMIDGEIYTIPLGVAKHLNTNCWYPIHSFMKDEQDRVHAKIGQKVRRCSFQSLEFIDFEGVKPIGSSTNPVEHVQV